jgi:F-type H+-transporting ATPase subunit epsilon
MADQPSLNLQLVTLLGQKMNEQVYEVVLPTTTGEISVFPGHESLVTLANSGVIAVRRKRTDTNDMLEYFATSGGVVEIDADRVRILVDEAEHGDDIIEAESEKALERALQMRDNAADQIELEKATELIDRHQTRLKVAGLRRHQNRTKFK